MSADRSRSQWSRRRRVVPAGAGSRGAPRWAPEGSGRPNQTRGYGNACLSPPRPRATGLATHRGPYTHSLTLSVKVNEVRAEAAQAPGEISLAAGRSSRSSANWPPTILNGDHPPGRRRLPEKLRRLERPWGLGPGLASRSACRTQLRSVSAAHPIFSAIEVIAAHCDVCS
jgi:hypothetical protein